MSQVRVLSPLLVLVRRLRGLTLLALAAGVAMLVIALAATLDHRHKVTVEYAAQEDAWFCRHGRLDRCRDFDEAAYEERWEQRELGYRVSFFTLGVAAAGLGVASLSRRRRARA
jgi:hypothetical protein